MKAQLDIAIGLLLNQGRVLVGWREAQQHQGNKYEFPGGKVEANETAIHACRREVLEEVGIELTQWHLLDNIQHEYEDVIVFLHVFAAHVPCELLLEIEAPWQWYTRQELENLHFPKANLSIIQNLVWPNGIKIRADLAHIEHITANQLFYWRIEATSFQIQDVLKYSVQQCQNMIINIEYWLQLPDLYKQYIHTIHLKQHQLAYLNPEQRVMAKRYIVACHDEPSMQQAIALACDAILLSPVLHTPTHPDDAPLGWEQFAHLAKGSPVPVFALGGLTMNDMAIAQQHGAYGVAGIRGM